MFRVMFRVLSLVVLVVLLGTLVASGVQHEWTTLHTGFGIALAVLAVVVAVPSR
jgi:hypothetical protein